MATDDNGFDTLLMKNVPHILEKIFLSLDYQSFKACQEVSDTWNQLLMSESFKAKAKSGFYEEISKELMEACEGDLWNQDSDTETEEGSAENKDQNHESEKGNAYADEVKRLLSTGMVDVNCVGGKYEETPLHVAALHGPKDVVQVLLDARANPNKADNKGETPLHKAVTYRNKVVVQILLDWGADMNKKRGIFEETPLHIAARNGDPEMVQLLLNGGAEINPKDHIGWTPYDHADERDDRHHGERHHRHPEVLALLGKHGGISRGNP